MVLQQDAVVKSLFLECIEKIAFIGLLYTDDAEISFAVGDVVDSILRISFPEIDGNMIFRADLV